MAGGRCTSGDLPLRTHARTYTCLLYDCILLTVFFYQCFVHPSGSKSNYSYQQQTDYSKQGPPSSDPNKQITTTIQSELKPPRSPGTPPLTDLLPSGGPANDDPNDRVVPPVGGEKRKRYPSDYHEIPEVKRQHYGSDVGGGGVGHGVGLGCGAGRGNVGRGSVGRGRGSVGRGVGRGSRWDNPEKKQKKSKLFCFLLTVNMYVACIHLHNMCIHIHT